jgi:cytochrome P450
MPYRLNDPPASRGEAHRALAELRGQESLHRDEETGFWLVTRYDDVVAISRQPELYSSALRGPWHLGDLRFSMQAQDGPAHLRTRQIVSRAFTPRAVAQLEPFVRACADAAIDAALRLRRCDFVATIAAPVPLRAIARLLGFDDAHLDAFQRWVDASAAENAAPGSAPELKALAAEVAATVAREAAAREREPRDDLMTALVQARAEGLLRPDAGEAWRGFDHADELVAFAQFLTSAGAETTRNAIAYGLLDLLAHPGERAKLAAEPGRWAGAVEEILRLASPVRALRRTLARDARLGARELRAGESVVMIYPSANRDEARFPEPDAFRVDRTPNEHLAFGSGTHFCLGASLARMEIRCVLSRVLERMPRIALDSELPIREGRHPIVASVEQLPIVAA